MSWIRMAVCCVLLRKRHTEEVVRCDALSATAETASCRNRKAAAEVGQFGGFIRSVPPISRRRCIMNIVPVLTAAQGAGGELAVVNSQTVTAKYLVAMLCAADCCEQ